MRVYDGISNKKIRKNGKPKVIAKITNPDGITETIPLDWNGSDRTYLPAGLDVGAAGIYRVEVEAAQGIRKSGNESRRLPGAG